MLNVIGLAYIKDFHDICIIFYILYIFMESHTLSVRGLFLLAGIFVSSFTIQAQEQYHHEIGFHLGGGLSTIQYTPPAGVTKSSGPGGMAGFEYTGFFSPQWGITTGLDLAFYSGSLTWDNFSLQYPVTPPSGLNGCTLIRGDFSNYKEQQYALLTQIPLMLQFQTTGSSRFYMAAGFKFGFPVYAVYVPTVGSVKVTGYGSGGQVYENRPEYGLDTYNDLTAFGHLDMRITALVSGEIGGKWKLSDDWNLYAGAYIDYGLDNMRKNHPVNQLVTYNSKFPKQPTYYSVLQSSESGNIFVEKVYPFSLGVKFRFTTNFGKMFASTRKEVKTTVAPASTTNVKNYRVVQQTQSPTQYTRSTDNVATTQRPSSSVAGKAFINPYWREVSSNMKKAIGNYRQDQTSLSDSHQMILNQYAEFLLQNPGLFITLEGHACNQGSKDGNYQLGLERAEMAKAYLICQGIDPLRIKVVSKGDLEPLVPNTSEANRRINRRVVFAVHE